MNLPAAGKRRLRATGYQNLLFGIFTRGKPRGIIPKVRLKCNSIKYLGKTTKLKGRMRVFSFHPSKKVVIIYHFIQKNHSCHKNS